MGALEQPMVAVINWGIAPAALGFRSGAKSVKVGVGGIMASQELSRQCHLTSGKASVSNGGNVRNGASLREDLFPVAAWCHWVSRRTM